MQLLSKLVASVLDGWSYPLAALAFLVENLALFAVALAGGALLVHWFRERRVVSAPPRIQPLEYATAAGTVLLNTLVTLAGLWLYRHGIIHIRHDTGLRALADAPLILLFMDAAMYALHRIAHIEPLFKLLHAHHHRYQRPRPLTLFVLHPLETLSFGGLWLMVITVYSASWLGISIYLTLNVVSGIVGHLGVEPMRRSWRAFPLAGGTFHAQHHRDGAHNYGFYSLVWDRLFGTLSPRYEDEFARLPELEREIPGEADRAQAILQRSTR